ncbi:MULTISPECIES: DUF2946 domain-containing protein [unclassified Paraburkholderia]|uniref:DUF2946 domain-containing protein n=1 Tax=unclassified Paraburkholderia TaxID=2615204 RepID=UPI002AB2845C|nr:MULTISPECIES: DUF2946 domain-containing protein [unclassified Paraburkholderia]
MSRIHLRLVSLLGTLAILMTTLAPVISHLLATSAASSGPPMTMTMSMSAHCDMPSMRHMQGAKHTTSATSRHDYTPNGDLQDCGYCNLLAHLPVVPGVPVTLALATRLVHARVAACFERLARVEPLSFALARAPPLV